VSAPRRAEPAAWGEARLWADDAAAALAARRGWGAGAGAAERVAVVGARAATPYGLEVAAALARVAARAGRVVVSGGARGVDSAAHAAALDAGGDSLAVLGAGLEHAPGRLGALRARGLGLLSPFEPHRRGAAWAFPRRNEQVAALCGAVLVAEAGAASGALMTARAALRRGRPVWVALGRLGEPSHLGCYALLDEGARALSGERAWLEGEGAAAPPAPLGAPPLGAPSSWAPPSWAPPSSAPSSWAPPSSAPPSSALLAAAAAEPAHIEELALRAGLPLPAAMAEAALLELDGWLRALPGGRYARAALP